MSWLRAHTDAGPATTPQDVQAALVRVGLEEEALHGGDVTGPVVVGRVLERVPEPQKNGRTINWCQVDVGAAHGGDGPVEGVRGIVCGAPNFDVGDHVVVALPGAVLPGGFAISARKTYGHLSDGMICSEQELGVGTDHSGIIVLTDEQLSGVRVGDDALPLLGLDDVVVEVNVTPDRGYCFSLRGLGREYALSTGGSFRDPVDPADVQAPPADGRGHEVRLEDTEPVRGRLGCRRYVARVVRGVDASAPSPAWMQRLLQQLGMRPISLAVDVTNWVMLVTGQPLHAFDLATLGGPVVVRRARAGERLTTLDDVDRALHPQDLLVTCDEPAGSRVLAVAGVMGGADSEVGPQTRDVLVESAWFDPVTVARSARRHKLSTEASRRFERGVDRDLADRAAELAVRLLVEHGGGDAASLTAEVTDVDLREPVPAVRMRADLPTRLVGRELDQATVEGALRAVGCTVRSDDGDDGDAPVLVVDPPPWRPDLVEGADLVEEVARVAGYAEIEGVLPAAPAGRGLTREQRLRRVAATALAGHGYVEVSTYPFVDPARHDALQLPADDPRRVALLLANPISEQAPQLRTSLLATLPDAARRNLARGARDLSLFEVGPVFRPEAGSSAGAAPEPPRPAPAVRPDEATLAAIRATVPPQPLHAAVLLTGQREPAGWWGAGRAADWTDAVDTVRGLADALGVPLVVAADRHAPWHPGRCARLSLANGTPDGALLGHAGELAPAVCRALELPERSCAAEVDLDVLLAAVPPVRAAAPVPTHPVALRDVALVVAADVPAAAVASALRDGAGRLLEQLHLFDEYRGEQAGAGRRSLAYRLVLRAPDRTLTGEEAAAVVAAAVAAAVERTGAEQRT